MFCSEFAAFPKWDSSEWRTAQRPADRQNHQSAAGSLSHRSAATGPKITARPNQKSTSIEQNHRARQSHADVVASSNGMLGPHAADNRPMRWPQGCPICPDGDWRCWRPDRPHTDVSAPEGVGSAMQNTSRLSALSLNLQEAGHLEAISNQNEHLPSPRRTP
jgi:hypothetical protein